MNFDIKSFNITKDNLLIKYPYHSEDKFDYCTDWKEIETLLSKNMTNILVNSFKHPQITNNKKYEFEIPNFYNNDEILKCSYSESVVTEKYEFTILPYSIWGKSKENYDLINKIYGHVLGSDCILVRINKNVINEPLYLGLPIKFESNEEIYPQYELIIKYNIYSNFIMGDNRYNDYQDFNIAVNDWFYGVGNW